MPILTGWSDSAFKVMRITDNYLHRDGKDMVWDQTNNKWKIITTHNGHQIITNIQFDDTEHKPDLFLYTNLHKSDDVDAVMNENSGRLDTSRNWYIKQMCDMDRIGIKRISELPLDRFLQHWRQPLNPRKMDFSTYRYQQGMIRFHYDDTSWPVFIRWLELGKPTPPKVGTPFRNRTRLDYDDDKLVNWVKKSCGKGIYMFSDFDSMFENEEDEFCYLTDILMFRE